MIDPAPVVLVAMPWASVRQPSLQLGILATRLRGAGIGTRCLYANLEFAARLGLSTYEDYSSFHNIIADWVFSDPLFPARDARSDRRSRFFAFASAEGCSAGQIVEIERIRAAVPPFLEWAMEAVDWSRVRVVGFTTTMLQPVPALALARQLKSRHPNLRVLFGGAGCSGSMGRAMHCHFPFIDGVVDGEADHTIVPIMKALIDDRAPLDIPGLTLRDARGAVTSTAPRPNRALEDYPIPDHEDYFELLPRYDFGRDLEVRVPFEASRGCWWAVESHCLFCGLNGEVLEQRARPVAEVVRELKGYRARFGVNTFVATDNIIAPRHLVHLPRALRAELAGAELFFEVRAVMSRAQLKGLSDGGVVHLQPGLESLIPEILKMVKKGTTPIVNLCFLRRAREFGQHAYWNFLYGFPGEERAWYDALLERLPAFFHLHAPDVVEFSLERFSPYFKDPGDYGVVIKGPREGYRHVFDLPDDAIADLCFDLDFDAAATAHRAEVGARLQSVVNRWSHSRAVLSLALVPDGTLRVDDTRPLARPPRPRIDADDALLLRTLESPSTIGRVCTRIMKWGAAAYLRLGGRAGVLRRLLALAHEHLVHEEDGRYLCLGVPEAPDFWLSVDEPDAAVAPSGERLIALLGRPRETPPKRAGDPAAHKGT